jgi:hypothetical protein
LIKHENNMNNDTSILNLLSARIGSADWSKWQIQRWTYWDYVRVPATGALSLSFFTAPQGSLDPVSATVKTLEQTNVPKARAFGQVYFIIQQIRTDLRMLPKARQTATTIATTDYSLNQLTAARQLRAASYLGVLNISIGQKDFFDILAPFRRCPAGFGLTNVRVPFARASNTAGNAFWQPSNSLSDVYSLSPPQMVEPEQTIEPTIDYTDVTPVFTDVFGSESANVEAGLILDGYLARPVQ